MNFIDKIVNYFSPQAGLKRAAARLAHQNVERKYDIARRGRSNNWAGSQVNNAREQSQNYLNAAEAAQQLTNNNPLAQNAKLTFGTSATGSKGVRLELRSANGNGRNNQNAAKRINEDFNDWAKSLSCDFDGDYNLYGIQWLAMCTVFETGGCFIRRHTPTNAEMAAPLQLQLLDMTMLDRTKNDGTNIFNGVQYNDDGQVEGYWLYIDKSGLNLTGQQKSVYLERNKEIVFLKRKERTGTHLAMTHLAQSGSLMDKYDVLLDAKVTQEQVAACLALIVEGAQSPMGIDSDSKGTNMLPDALEPGMIEYVDPGTQVHTVSPNSTNNSTLGRDVKQDMATGLQMSYSTFTGDYSQFNFASGRLAQLAFDANISFIQENVLIPQLDILWGWWAAAYGLRANQQNVAQRFRTNWIVPPKVVVDPQKELDQLVKEVRSGFKAPSTAVTQWTGNQLTDVVDQWSLDRDTWGDLPFDTNPALFTIAGNQLNTDDAASANVATANANQGANDDATSADNADT